MSISEDMIKNFVNRCNAEIMAGNTPSVLGYKIGRRYTKIISKRFSDDLYGSAWGFIDMTNGNILKAASWSAPAKNFSRGNINNLPDNLSPRYSWTGIS
jgi:hypothetical protein